MIVAAILLLILQQAESIIGVQGGDTVPNIKKMSSLRNYTAVLDEVAAGRPVMLERDGVGKYAILDMEEYDAMRHALWGRLFDDLDGARQSAETDGWISHEDLRSRLSAHAKT